MTLTEPLIVLINSKQYYFGRIIPFWVCLHALKTLYCNIEASIKWIKHKWFGRLNLWFLPSAIKFIIVDGQNIISSWSTKYKRVIVPWFLQQFFSLGENKIFSFECILEWCTSIRCKRSCLCKRSINLRIKNGHCAHLRLFRSSCHLTRYVSCNSLCSLQCLYSKKAYLLEECMIFG